MRPFLFIFLAAVTLGGCSKDIQSNSPAMQGNIDNVFFKALDAQGVVNEDGSYTLQGTRQDQIVTLHINKGQLGSYPLGEGQPNFATYEDEDGNLYTTSPNGEGVIELTNRCISCGWLSGSFKFKAILPGIDTVQVDGGIYYQVSFLDGTLIGDNDPSNDGTMEAEVDGLTFEAVTVSADESGNSLLISGAIDEKVINIVVPVGAGSGNNSLPAAGFSASYNDGTIVEEALSGQITVNFNNGSDILIFFHFETENHSITNGRTDVDY